MNRILQELKRRVVRLAQACHWQKVLDFIAWLMRGLRRLVGRGPKAPIPPASMGERFSRLSALAKAPLPRSDIVIMRGGSREAEADAAARADGRAPGRDDGSEFASGTFTHASQTRRYRFFTPPNSDGRHLPLVVMLHGCKQDADDFATGTGMNAVAREQGFYVLYPEQSQGANPFRCWNWFKHSNQQRDRGEPALIAAMTREMMAGHAIDAERVYIAGLSAGAAMSVIVAAAYPDLFAAVGVHSGLARGAASNALEAMTVMKNGMPGDSMPRTENRFGFSSAAAAARAHLAVPTIVFHGDEDRTVNPRNGEQVLAAALIAAIDDNASNDESSSTSSRDQAASAAEARRSSVHQGESAHGQRYTRAVHHDEAGKAFAEHWVLHGAGHAWSGGHADGSYTDAAGPDASREMLRFFLQQRRRSG